MKVPALLLVLGFAFLTASASFGILRMDAPRGGVVVEPGQRVVSLTPAITQTLFAIGAGAAVAGVSDYCDEPPQVNALPRLGTGITPRYEQIAELRPALIVSEETGASRGQELEAIAPTLLLPWLSLDEIVKSTRALGTATGHEAKAEALAERLETRLGVTPPPGAPRVLLVLGYEPERLKEIWFIRRNSLHGAALHAAGAQNAVDRDVFGLPRLGLERLLEIDPDAIIVLVARPVEPAGILNGWRALAPLRAVVNQRVSVIDAPEAFDDGPRIFRLVERLERELARLFPGKDRPR